MVKKSLIFRPPGAQVFFYILKNVFKIKLVWHVTLGSKRQVTLQVTLHRVLQWYKEHCKTTELMFWNLAHFAAIFGVAVYSVSMKNLILQCNLPWFDHSISVWTILYSFRLDPSWFIRCLSFKVSFKDPGTWSEDGPFGPWIFNFDEFQMKPALLI